ncbi:MAG TPA: hypothetical protein VF131_27685 [Blastocatellia bacterium]|nr:hypothetical protein [Blastocatellia bacterium]
MRFIRMSFIAPVLLALLLPTGAIAQQKVATSSTARFKYQPDKIEVGTVYHYTKSNLDGSKPITVSIFVTAKDRLEVTKAEEGNIDSAHVIAEMDWNKFSARHLNAGVILKDGSRQQRVTLELSTKDDSVIIKVGGQEKVVAVGHYPFHIYNFDFISLNFIFRHLTEPEAGFEIGVGDPTFDERIFAYKGKASFQYVEDASIHGVECRKYRVSGEAFAGREGTIWVNKKLGYVENIEIPVRDNPDWKDFKFELKAIQKMSPEEWKKYMFASIGKRPY